MKNTVILIMSIILAFVAGAFVTDYMKKPTKLDFQMVAFSMVDAIEYCHINNIKEPQYSCDRIEELLPRVLIEDPKREETVQRISKYIGTKDSMSSKTKTKILELLK